MKYKLLILMSSILFSCGKNKYEQKILGNWYSFNEKFKLEFYTDSLFISDIQNQKTLWNADKFKLNYDYKGFLSDSIQKVSLNYSINEINDSLILIAENKNIRNETFIRSNSYLEFLSKKNNIDFSLKDSNVDLSLTENQNRDAFNSKHFEIKIFIGYVNKKLTIKTEYSPDIENLQNDFKKHCLNYERELKYEYDNYFRKDKIDFEEYIRTFTYYAVYADKKTPKDILEKCIDKLKTSDIKKVYEIFNTLELNKSGMARYNHFASTNGVKR